MCSVHSNALKASLSSWKNKEYKENSCPMVPQSGPIAESCSVLKEFLKTKKVPFGLPAMRWEVRIGNGVCPGAGVL